MSEGHATKFLEESSQLLLPFLFDLSILSSYFKATLGFHEAHLNQANKAFVIRTISSQTAGICDAGLVHVNGSLNGWVCTDIWTNADNWTTTR